MFAEQFAMDRLEEALFAYSVARTSQIRPDDRFAHYTNVEVAKKIVEADPGSRSLWLRNTQGMNDFSEVKHGLECLNEALDDWRLEKRFKQVLNAIKPGMGNEIIEPMLDSAIKLVDQAYLTSFSLHDREESLSGKLSMWRAYGGPNNVCLIFNTQPFVSYQTAWELVLSPVLYGGPAEFKREFGALIQRLERCVRQLSTLESDIVQANINRALNFATLSTKHYGFHEEVEWRVIHQPSNFRASPPSQTVLFNNKSELVYHLPIEKNDEGGVWGASLDEVLDRVIVGPIANSNQVKEQLVRLLGEAGITRAEQRVVDCGIPFRNQHTDVPVTSPQ